MLSLTLSALVLIGAPAPDLVPYSLDEPKDYKRALSEFYTKREFEIPMRDGVRLHTAVWTPKDRSQKWPMLMVRTPYGVASYGVENPPPFPRSASRFAPSSLLVKSGYIFVHQDVRGRLMSEGTFVDVRPRGKVDETTDAYDTVDWLVKNVPNNNRRVGIWGISYPGFYAAQAAVNAHPAVKAISPQAPVTEWFIGDDFHHGGALCLADAVQFYANFGRAREKPVKKIKWDFETDIADVYDLFLRLGPISNVNKKYLKGDIAFWNQLLEHPDRDAWWQARDPRPSYKNIRPAMLVVGGWFDAEDLWGSLETYQAMQRQTKRGDISLVMGPWQHGGWARTEGDHHGDITFGQKTSPYYRKQIEYPFFEKHLKLRNQAKTPKASIFVTGVNEWRTFSQWPPRRTKVKTLFLQEGGALSTKAPTASAAADSYLADPLKPVPYYGRPSERISRAFMTADQRFAARRPDVLVYETTVLKQGVTVVGPIEADIWLQTTGTDADVVVKLVDIWPEDTHDPKPNPRAVRMGGYQQLVRAEVIRGRYRQGFEKGVPFVPGQPTKVHLRLPDIAHTFRTGHRIQVQVQSSWFPFVDSNPQTFVEISKAQTSDFVKATQTVHRSQTHASGLRVKVLEGKLP